MIGRKIYDDPMFLRNLEREIFDDKKNITRKEVVDQYLEYAEPLSKQCISNYLLLRHLFSLYYNTSSSKKWKKFLHDIIQHDKDIMLINDFEESIYEEKISSYS